MTRGWLRRVTFNATEPAIAALDGLSGQDQTDAINRAIRLAAAVSRYTSEDGRLTVLTPDGKTIEIHII